VAAYVIVDLTVTDLPAMEEYRKRVPATLTPYGGRFLVRGGAHETVEGDWKPNRVVVLEFPSMDHAKRWYRSEEYREPLAMRLRAGQANMIMVDGVAPA
jgi:uncharacterized protein (DUF1330 family)